MFFRWKRIEHGSACDLIWHPPFWPLKIQVYRHNTLTSGALCVAYCTLRAHKLSGLVIRGKQSVYGGVGTGHSDLCNTHTHPPCVQHKPPSVLCPSCCDWWTLAARESRWWRCGRQIHWVWIYRCVCVVKCVVKCVV
jgi:hypothetical protein